jgi:hypothetical protein
MFQMESGGLKSFARKTLRATEVVILLKDCYTTLVVYDPLACFSSFWPNPCV